MEDVAMIRPVLSIGRRRHAKALAGTMLRHEVVDVEGAILDKPPGVPLRAHGRALEHEPEACRLERCESGHHGFTMTLMSSTCTVSGTGTLVHVSETGPSAAGVSPGIMA